MVLRHTHALLLVASASASASSAAVFASTSSTNSVPYPSLDVVESALLTTADSDFGGHSKAFEAAAAWNGKRLRARPHRRDPPGAPHLCCADYEHGREAYSMLQDRLSPEAVRPVAHSEEHGACYFATASNSDAAAILENHEQLRLKSFAPFPSALKIAPGILEHGQSNGPGRLSVGHGALMRKDNVEGLSVDLAPGTLPAHSWEAGSYIQDMLGELMSESIDLHSTNFWSDPAMADGEHLATAEGAARGQDWRKAAAVVHGLSEAASRSPGDICSWNSVRVHHAGDDLLLVSGLDHLLYSGRGAGGTSREGEAAELHVACFMGLVSFLAGRLEVLRVASRHTHSLLNASARANIQSATTTDTPLTDAGLDGTGQVVQVVDTGLDESSCFFAHDADGDHVPHGFYYDEWGINFDFSSLTDDLTDEPTDDDNSRRRPTDDDSSRPRPKPESALFSGRRDRRPGTSSTSSEYQYDSVYTGGDFRAYPDRRKIVQYINLIKSDDEPQSHGNSFTSGGGEQFSWLPADEFEYDYKAGHGTHTAGSVAGATLNNPAELATCEAGKTVSCVGGCIDDSTSATDDDLVSYYYQYADIDRLCPLSSEFGCDDTESNLCLGDDVSETLTKNGGMAQGAKLAIFDAFYGDFGLMTLIVNDLWESCAEADCKLHSNSWGGDYECQLGSADVAYDEFMYQNPENLLIFAAGNLGNETRSTCTMGSPAIAKNVLAVGGTTSGSTRFSVTGALFPEVDASGIDTVAYFSSYGPTTDGRIKPEVMAPGDMVYSAASDGSEESHSCRLWAYHGTSMSCPIVAGASAMVRQYFMDSAFYAMDMATRGFCDEWSGCAAFPPSSATIKALLINSANLMGGSSEPDGERGFGRIHLEAGMPLAGKGGLVLFVADAANTTILELTRVEYNFDVDAEAGLDFRATLSWIDPPAHALAAEQQVHDLDLAVISPSGVRHVMWASGKTDTVNVNERVIVDAADVESGVWSVWVWAKRLTTSDEQSYSLVVNGAISPATDIGAIERSSSTSSFNSIDSASPADPQIAVEGESSGSLTLVPPVSNVLLSLLVFVAVSFTSAAACTA